MIIRVLVLRMVLYCGLIFGGLFFQSVPTLGDTAALAAGISTERPTDGPSVKVGERYMVPYIARIPGTEISFEMVPVPGGEYLMGSPETEADREPDEGPQIKVQVDPMWVAKTEVNWQQYHEFMAMHDVFGQFQADGIRVVDEANLADAVTAPTPLYDPSETYEYGEEPDQPATTMTQYAAQQFTKWLSGITGQQYRLPTEAEWEYAARGGTTTAYSWPDDESIDDHAWYFENSDSGPVAVASKNANPFGLHDMHGSVGEWTVNYYTADGYAGFVDKQPINATDVVVWPTSEWPCVVRGGTWEDDADRLRSAARMASKDEETWKDGDPNIPMSAWWYTVDPTRGIGFRVFRSYQPLPKEKISQFWNTSAEDILEVVEFKISDGRANLGLVDPALADAIKQAAK